jgi:hypothetical protein
MIMLKRSAGVPSLMASNFNLSNSIINCGWETPNAASVIVDFMPNAFVMTFALLGW